MSEEEEVEAAMQSITTAMSEAIQQPMQSPAPQRIRELIADQVAELIRWPDVKTVTVDIERNELRYTSDQPVRLTTVSFPLA